MSITNPEKNHSYFAHTSGLGEATQLQEIICLSQITVLTPLFSKCLRNRQILNLGKDQSWISKH